MSTAEFERFADVIDANLEHLHRERWNKRAAELHAEVARLPDGVSAEQAAEALRDHYADRFRPETSRDALLEQAAITAAKRGRMIYRVQLFPRPIVINNDGLPVVNSHVVEIVFPGDAIETMLGRVNTIVGAGSAKIIVGETTYRGVPLC